MVKVKYIPLISIVLCALLPWNATAVNQERLLAKRLLAQPFSGGSHSIEGMLAKTLSEVKRGQLNDALTTVDRLIEKTPNFKLAYAIRGDLLTAKIGAIKHFADANQDQKQVNDLKQEAETRLQNYFEGSKENAHPNLLIRLSEQQHHALVLDVSKSRLFLYTKDDQHSLEYVADYYVTIGRNGSDKKVEGDKRTPLGVYFASSKLNQKLPDLYGIGAYPLNYPNEIDQYERRNGYGIWLHGTPSDTYSRPPRASDGCVVLSNPDLKALHPILKKGNTPVIIANNLEWVAEGKHSTKAQQSVALEQAIEAWRQDWVNQDTKRYLSHYSKRFFSSKGDYRAWADYKARVQAGKPKAKIEINNLSMFTYPTAKDPMVVVNFEQLFQSATLRNKMVKRQYWVNENNQWKIIYEGAA